MRAYYFLNEIIDVYTTTWELSKVLIIEGTFIRI